MIDQAVLFVLAELAVALAGFSAIIGVLSTRRDSTDLKVNALRLQVMLETCFMVAAVALIPIILDKFGVNHNLLWRAASAAFLCIAIPFEIIARNRTKHISNMTLTRINVNTINWVLSIGADLVLVAILLNLVGTWSDAFYIVALFAQLTLAGILFVQFAGETFSHPDRG